MSVTISDETLLACGMTETEFRQEVALLLFQSGKLALGHASKLAQMNQIHFRQLLKERKIPLYSYDLEDFELELENLRELGRF
jgi:predicted HTH domain antitoxin